MGKSSVLSSPTSIGPTWSRREKPKPLRAALQGAVDDLAGNLDSVSRQGITGWAQDPRDPSRRVGLAVYVDGRVVGRLLADRFRADLRTAGIGDGHHAFEFILPRLSPFARHEVRLTREIDGKNLPGSPFVIEPAGALDAETEAGLAFIAADLSEARVLEAMATVLPKPE